MKPTRPNETKVQARDHQQAYDRYLAGMDASMKQKVALSAAHLVGVGTVADMGMGSGTGTDALAALYPGLEVVGVDLDPEMVERARQKYRRDNLDFIVGDISEVNFDEASLDGIFLSSVLHHVTTYSGYDHEAAGRTLAACRSQLRERGTLIVRDFLAQPNRDVLLDLPDDDGHDDPGDPEGCSTATLFSRFATEFRSLRPPSMRGFSMRELEPPQPSWRRFSCRMRHAVEFVLRKDYRRSWEAEVEEEYTYFDQRQFEAAYARLGLRVLASTPILNPWIVKNRFAGRFVLRDAHGSELDWPATNYVIAGERVAPQRGVAFSLEGPSSPMGYLEFGCWRHAESGQVRDLVRRPNPTVDFVPWFSRGGEIYVLARASYPRPILALYGESGPELGNHRPPHWVSEPLNVVQTDKPLAQTVEEALAELANIEAGEIVRFEPGLRYTPSPGGIQEEVRSILVEVEPTMVELDLTNRSGFSSSGYVRAMEARQVLRSAQVGGLPDARLELNVYHLLAQRCEPLGAWIGANLDLTEDINVAVTKLQPVAPRRCFRRVDPTQSTTFLTLQQREFVELDHGGTEVGRQALEYVAPTRLSASSIVALPIGLCGGEVVVGLDDDDLPAAQCFTGHSGIWVAPAWRLPRELTSWKSAHTWVGDRLQQEYGITTRRLTPLGGPYYPSPGLTPEVVYPLAAVVSKAAMSDRRSLTWVSLRELRAARLDLLDGHLLICAHRAAHAMELRNPDAQGATHCAPKSTRTT